MFAQGKNKGGGGVKIYRLVFPQYADGEELNQMERGELVQIRYILVKSVRLEPTVSHELGRRGEGVFNKRSPLSQANTQKGETFSVH